MTNKPNTEKAIERSAKEYAESCDNESGGFLTNQLIAIRTKAFLAGVQLCESKAKESETKMRDLVEIAKDYKAFLKSRNISSTIEIEIDRVLKLLGSENELG